MKQTMDVAHVNSLYRKLSKQPQRKAASSTGRVTEGYNVSLPLDAASRGATGTTIQQSHRYVTRGERAARVSAASAYCSFVELSG